MTTKANPSETSYPLSTSFNIAFSPYEDRLVLNAQRPNHGPAHLLLTRRMSMIVLQQLLIKLPELTGLGQTPTAYWKEVLQMAHQKAMQAKQDADGATEAAKAEHIGKAEDADKDDNGAKTQAAIFLATELTTRLDEKQLILGFKGLPMPQAMTQPSPPQPVLAMPLAPDNVHQLIELLIKKAQAAHWHLPLDLPWLDSPEPQDTTLGVLLH